MTSDKFVKKIKNYAVASFLVPLIAINSCLLIYKYLGDINVGTYPNLKWDEAEHTYTHKEFFQLINNVESYAFMNCSKYLPEQYIVTTDNQTILVTTSPSREDLINKLYAGNKVKSIILKSGKILDVRCIKNQSSYSLIKKFSWLDSILTKTTQSNPAGFAKIKNPYFYGEVSISRTARYFPAILIFKSLIILSAFLLFLYWKNNLNLFSELKNKNIFDKFSKKFFYLGVFSCIFLLLHAIFLGLDFDSKLFAATRKIIIISFILFEVSAQILLTINLFKFREKLKKYINPLILKIKIFFVTTIFFITCVAFTILVFGDPSAAFKHTLEWNYFSSLLFYYMLSRLLWK